MSASILVGYATNSGSTQEVAETIAATLRVRAVWWLPARAWDRPSDSSAGARGRSWGRRSICSAGTRTPSVFCRAISKRSWPGRWRSSPWGHSTRSRRSSKKHVPSLTRNCSSFPGLRRWLSFYSGRQVRPAEAAVSHEPAPGPQADAAQRHPRLGGDSHLGERSGRSAVAGVPVVQAMRFRHVL